MINALEAINFGSCDPGQGTRTTQGLHNNVKGLYFVFLSSLARTYGLPWGIHSTYSWFQQFMSRIGNISCPSPSPSPSSILWRHWLWCSGSSTSAFYQPVFECAALIFDQNKFFIVVLLMLIVSVIIVMPLYYLIINKNEQKKKRRKTI